MPEFPDIVVYQESLFRVLNSYPLERVRLASPFVLRSVGVPAQVLEGLCVRNVRRFGKRLVLCLDQDYFIVMHLMIAGRLVWGARRDKLPGRMSLAAFDFSHGTLLFTEASKKKRAALHFVRGEANLVEHQRAGVEVFECTEAQFIAALRCENHTLKRSLTDPRLFAGIGNAYSDEILHHARLSPVRLTQKLTDEECLRLFASTRQVLKAWLERFRKEAGTGFPGKVTAFRPEMAVHGKYRAPCPVCGKPVQRIVHAENETNYCAECQNGGRLLADRSLSRLLKQDWPRTLEELDEQDAQRKQRPLG